MADLISAMSFDAFDCIVEPLDAHIHAIRAHKGQVTTAAALRNYLELSEIANQKSNKYRILIRLGVFHKFMGLPKMHLNTCNPFSCKK